MPHPRGAACSRPDCAAISRTSRFSSTAQSTNKNGPLLRVTRCCLVPRAGFEPATCPLGGGSGKDSPFWVNRRYSYLSDIYEENDFLIKADITPIHTFGHRFGHKSRVKTVVNLHRFLRFQNF